MSERTLLVAAAIAVALSMLLFLAPLVGIILVALAAVGVPALLFLDRGFLDRNRAAGRHRRGTGASGPRQRGYGGAVNVGEEGAGDYDYQRRAS